MDIVLVGIDGSGNAREALRTAIAEAAWRNAEVLAVHVVHYPASAGFDPAFSVAPETLLKVGSEALHDEVTAVEVDYPDGFPVHVRQKVLLGHTGTQLLHAANDDEHVVLTVAGSRGLGGFKGLLLGSTTAYLVHHLESPLLVVPKEPREGVAA